MTQIHNPLSKDALKGDFILTPGECEYVVTELKESISKSSGQSMLSGKIKAKDSKGKSSNIFIYLPLAGVSIAHFFSSIGQFKDYESGSFDPESYVGCEGICTVDTDVSAVHGSKSVVKKWLPANEVKRKSNPF